LHHVRLDVELDPLGRRAQELVAGLTPSEQEQAWLASMALLRRARADPSITTPLPVESAFEAAVHRLRAAKGGDEVALLGFGRLVREGYLAAREESLASFTADLDQSTRLAVTTLACFAHRTSGQAPEEAVLQALRVAYDRVYDPDQALVERSAQVLAAALQEVEASSALRNQVTRFVTGHMRSLDGLLG
jgi:hypothetical protein